VSWKEKATRMNSPNLGNRETNLTNKSTGAQDEAMATKKPANRPADPNAVDE